MNEPAQVPKINYDGMFASAAPRYMFTINAPLSTRWVGKNPAGFRLDLEYAGPDERERVFTDQGKLDESWPETKAILEEARRRANVKRDNHGAVERCDLETANIAANYEKTWFGLKGTIAAGMDWATLRADGVVDFDGRLTLRDTKGILINAVVLGSADLIQPGETRPLTLDMAVEALRQVKGGKKIGFAVALRFEAAQHPEPWAAKRYQTPNALKYQRLSRGQCVGIGTVASLVHDGACIDIDVVSFVPPAIQQGAGGKR